MNGILAGFDTPDDLQRALARLREARIDALETYTPVPLEEEAGGSQVGPSRQMRIATICPNVLMVLA